MENKSVQRYLILFIPWMVSLVFQSDAIMSYFIAWAGSIFIFYISLSGILKKLPDDRAVSEQLMRPIFLVQVIFAGYMCLTSIFYFFSVLGYDDFHKTISGYLTDQNQLQLTAQCQRYYCLAHASLVSGMLIFMKYPVKK